MISNLPISSGTYTASGTITSTGRVDNGSNVTFKAGTAVLLNPGFETKQGAIFLGKTETGQSANYTQDYVMGIEYQNTVMQAIYNSEGRLYFTGSTTRYEYTMTDHLGNARVSFTDQNADGTPEIIQENHYYPFGLAMEGPWVNDPAEDNKYTYNGKELNDDFGLGWMDYGARWYDAAIGRWNGVDPLAEKMKSWSAYNYVFNNPTGYIDPEGTTPLVYNWTTGQYEDKDGNVASWESIQPDWVPDENGNLIAETGDNAQTLYDFFGGDKGNISISDAEKLFASFTGKAGDILKLDNVFTKAIESDKGGGNMAYSCYLAALCGSSMFNTSIPSIEALQMMESGRLSDWNSPRSFDEVLLSSFENIPQNEAIFGSTVIRFSGEGKLDYDALNILIQSGDLSRIPTDVGGATHAAVFYGKDRAGNYYIFSKNGFARPIVMKLDSSFISTNYGAPLGISNTNVQHSSGYYNPKGW